MLLNTGSAQTANPTPETTTTTTTTTTSPAVAPTDETDQTTPTLLTPFEVDSSQDTGYRARNTLAGSRVNTKLDDVASPITVVTKDFIDDIGAVDVNDIRRHTAKQLALVATTNTGDHAEAPQHGVRSGRQDVHMPGKILEKQHVRGRFSVVGRKQIRMPLPDSGLGNEGHRARRSPTLGIERVNDIGDFK